MAIDFNFMYCNSFICQSQLGDLKSKLTTDTSLALIHFIYIGWVKNLTTSTLAFNIVQFFLLLNHKLLLLILGKAGFKHHVITFFSNYLINRKTWYYWNNFSSNSFNINVGVGQGLVLSPILLALYLALFLHILEKHLKNLNLQISIISFVDNRLLITQNKSFNVSNSWLFCSYNITFNLLSQFCLWVEHFKTKVFHFLRSRNNVNSPSLDLSSLGGPILYPKSTWKYLGFIFDRKLTFHNYIDFYSNKAILIVKCMKILSNSIRGLNPNQKRLLYRSCALPIALYGFQLWYFHRAPLLYPLKILGKLQRRAAI